MIKEVLPAFLAILALGGCSSEAATRVELGPPADDPNAQSSLLVQAHAEQQCLDDDELETGFVQIVAEDGTVANTYEVECAEVRIRFSTSESVGLERLTDE